MDFDYVRAGLPLTLCVLFVVTLWRLAEDHKKDLFFRSLMLMLSVGTTAQCAINFYDDRSATWWLYLTFAAATIALMCLAFVVASFRARIST